MKRVYHVAKEFGISSRQVIDALAELGVDAKSHSFTVDDADVELLKELREKSRHKMSNVRPRSPKAASYAEMIWDPTLGVGHDSRIVEEICISEGTYALGRDSLFDNEPAAIVFSPASVIRRLSPLSVAFMQGATPKFIVPMSYLRLKIADPSTCSPEELRWSRQAFAAFWNKVMEGLRQLVSSPARLVEFGRGVGDFPSELPASKGRAWLPLVQVYRDRVLYVPLRDRENRTTGVQEYEAPFEAVDVLDTESGGRLDRKRGAMEPKPGVADLSSLALLPQTLGNENQVSLSEAAVASIRDHFLDWLGVRRGWDLWECSKATTSDRRCDQCSDRDRAFFTGRDFADNWLATASRAEMRAVSMHRHPETADRELIRSARKEFGDVYEDHMLKDTLRHGFRLQVMGCRDSSSE